MNVLTIGGATQDIFIEYQAQTADIQTQSGKRCFLIMEEGKKIEIDNLSYFTGGGATNAAVSFKKLGCNVAAIFKIGTDVPGTYIIEDLKKVGINTEYHVASSTVPTAQSFIIPCPSGDRTILAYRGANKTLELHDINEAAFKNMDQLYITSLSGHAAAMLVPLVQRAHAHKIPIAVNPGSSQLKEGADQLRLALPYITTLILNMYEAQLLMTSINPQQSFDLNSFLKTVLAMGPKIVVVTDGAQGVYAATGNQIFFHPALKATIISSVGAGDAFGSCFIGSLLLGSPLEDAIRFGMLNAASVIASVGAKTGLLSQNQLQEQLKSLDKNLLTTTILY